MQNLVYIGMFVAMMMNKKFEMSERYVPTIYHIDLLL